MDITGMMKDISLTNLEWMNSKDNFEPSDKSNSKKEELGVEWGREIGDIGADEPVTIMKEMKSRSPEDSTMALIDSASVLMHQGFSKEEIIKQLKFVYLPEAMEAAKVELNKLFKNSYGIVGCVVIDLRNSRIVDKVVKASQKSPFKKFIKYAMMTKEQIDGNSNVAKIAQGSKTNIKSGSIDSFFSSSESKGEVKNFYKPLNMPIIAFEGEIDDSWVNDRIIDIVDLKAMSKDEAEEITNDDIPAEDKLRKAFSLVMERNYKLRKEKYAQSVKHNSSDFNIAMANSIVAGNFDINEENKQENIEVDEKKADLDFEVESQSDIGNDEDLTSGMTKNNIDDFEVTDVFNGIDVDSDQFVEKELEGCDEFDMDEEKPADEQLDIEEKADFSF
jgi:hypothetical protein